MAKLKRKKYGVRIDGMPHPKKQRSKKSVGNKENHPNAVNKAIFKPVARRLELSFSKDEKEGASFHNPFYTAEVEQKPIPQDREMIQKMHSIILQHDSDLESCTIHQRFGVQPRIKLYYPVFARSDRETGILKFRQQRDKSNLLYAQFFRLPLPVGCGDDRIQNTVQDDRPVTPDVSGQSPVIMPGHAKGRLKKMML